MCGFIFPCMNTWKKQKWHPPLLAWSDTVLLCHSSMLPRSSVAFLGRTSIGCHQVPKTQSPKSQNPSLTSYTNPNSPTGTWCASNTRKWCWKNHWACRCIGCQNAWPGHPTLQSVIELQLIKPNKTIWLSWQRTVLFLYLQQSIHWKPIIEITVHKISKKLTHSAPPKLDLYFWQLRGRKK